MSFFNPGKPDAYTNQQDNLASITLK